MLSGNKYC